MEEKVFGQLKQMEPVQRLLPSTHTVREALQASVKRECWWTAWAKVRRPSCREGAGPGSSFFICSLSTHQMES